jgi:hypothetical protein
MYLVQFTSLSKRDTSPSPVICKSRRLQTGLAIDHDFAGDLGSGFPFPCRSELSVVKSSPVFRWLCGASVVHRRTSRWPRSTKPVASSRACPAVLGPDPRRAVEQTVFILLLGQSRELGMERMIGSQERLIAMEDRWIGTGGVVEAVNLASAERELGASNFREFAFSTGPVFGEKSDLGFEVANVPSCGCIRIQAPWRQPWGRAS